MHRLDFTSVGIHATRCLARFDVAPYHGCHIALVVHEAGVEVGSFVRVWGHDVRASAREGVFEEVEHGEELARRHYHVVSEPTCDNRVVHHRLVGLVLEVAVPAGAELLARPAIHHVEFSLGGPDLDTSFNAVSGKWTSAVDVPLLEDLLLDLGIATHKVVERLDMGLGAVSGESEAGNC